MPFTENYHGFGRFRLPPLIPALLVIGLAAIAGTIATWAVTRAVTINIGFLGSFTGPNGAITAMARDGALLAVEECDQAGGIRGAQVCLLVGDDGASPAKVVSLLDNFIRSDCWAIVGPTASGVLASATHVAAGRATLISPTIDADGRGLTDLFTIGPSESHTLEYAARYLYVQRHLRRPVVILGASATATSEALNTFSSWMNGPDSGVVRVIQGASASTSLMDVGTDVTATPADCVIVLAPSAEAALIIQHLRLAGCSLPVVVPQCLAANELILYGGKAVEGVTLFSTVDVAHATSAYRAFADRFERRFGYPPSLAGARGFEAARVALLAVGQAANPAEVGRVVASRRSFDGLHGRIIFNETGDTIRELVAVQIRDGAIRAME